MSAKNLGPCCFVGWFVWLGGLFGWVVVFCWVVVFVEWFVFLGGCGGWVVVFVWLFVLLGGS